MTKEQEVQFEQNLTKTIDEAMEKNVDKLLGPAVAKEVAEAVKSLRLREAMGDKRVSDETKTKLVNTMKRIHGLHTKDTSALILDQDNRGGYLVPVEVADEILRIVASVGVVASQATKWTMNSDELDIPSYRGSILTGGFLGVDTAGTTTGLTFNSARLMAKQWQLAFVVGNDLLADSSTNLADWLMALAGEAMANMIDQQAFIGGSTTAPGPFVGVTADPTVTSYSLGNSTTSGSTTAAKISFADLNNIIGSVEESVLDGAAFYFHRTTLAIVRSLSDQNNMPIVAQANAAQVLVNEKGGGPKVQGMILGYPVYTVRHLPTYANSVSASTIFAVFGNMKMFAYGERGGMTVAQFESGAFGGNEIALTNQRAFVVRNRIALVNALPAAFINITTSAS